MARRVFYFASLLILLAIGLICRFVDHRAVWLLVPVVPLVGLGVWDSLQSQHTILRNFPLIGHFRYMFEAISPEIQQYFIERHTDGTPISRNHRAVVYQRSKELSPTHPFGTELDLYGGRYEGLSHSIYPADPLEQHPRVRFGGPACLQPYEASLLNVSAMSFGALSSNAVQALSHAAAAGGFYVNTGEGGLTDHHLEGNCDVVWQIGTGYFGCRTKEGRFCPKEYEKRARLPQVKMIELKLSQGAKPGHGGVLPAVKNTEEIAKIRLIEANTIVKSPPGHLEFSDAKGLLRFLERLRELSGGKPVGFKLCIGIKEEFREICRQMTSTGIRPDFITVDGAEGGTGAAPLEFTDSVGIPMVPALRFVHQELQAHGHRPHVRLICSGKVVTAASLVRCLALGADTCNAARAFMLSLGCIQALRCDTNKCPTGVATQDPALVKGLVVADKTPRVTSFHQSTVTAALELMAACGVRHPKDLTPDILIDGSDWERWGAPEPG